MTAPFADALALGETSRLLIGVAVGVAFGWALERAGLGSARKLVGQFHLTDLAVFKVMFSAIGIAMLGLFWLSYLGLLDLTLVYVPETFLWPQLVGGLVFGTGFALGGLCPGTACVSAATGRLDGAAAVAGVFLGVLSAGVGMEHAQTFYESSSRGPLTISDMIGVSSGVVVFVVVCLALAGFAAAEAVERRSRE